MRGARRHPRFRVGLVAVLAVAAFALAGGCGRRVAQEADEPSSPEDIRELVKLLNQKGPVLLIMGRDSRVVAADRLAALGPPAKEYGAVEPLRRLATNKDAKVAAAAKAALAKIEGQ
ncbi:MAG: hypothetical protein HYX69_22735 [Planctomycetia bacterium]|nr:hypothetical protein [Planctomycetia bacterium]